MSTEMANKVSEPSLEFVEGIRLRNKPAPAVKRFVALCIDMGIISAALYAVLFAAFLFGGLSYLAVMAATSFSDTAKGVGAIVGLLVLLLLALGVLSLSHVYFIYFEYKKGATLGKRFMGLTVVSMTGGPVTKRQAVYRELVRWYVDLIFILPALISMMVTKNRQRVGDLLADTMVVHSSVAEARDRHVYVGREDYVALLEHLQPKPVPTDLRTDYLRFATSAYLSGDSAALSSEGQWLQAVRAHLDRSYELGLNDYTVLRFFAELCFQENLKETKQAKG